MSTVSLTIDGAVARLTLERPEVLNALNREIAGHLERALVRLEAARDVAAVVLSGRGRGFCAGNDIAEMPGLAPAEAEALSRRWQDIMDRFARLPQVTIAAVHGYALGGGCMLAAAQDLRLAGASARFGLPEVTLGFNPGKSALYCGYSVVSSVGQSASLAPAGARGHAAFPVAPTGIWWYASGICDNDGDSTVNATYVVTSESQTPSEQNVQR